ncbi:hypothetical protein N7492_007348 [Penicillium capsulatum]|uniref:NADP-dependent oxidoreductase domain-containing protein n=1 Tax=Penicillium capsulatum TaxID=69766 RepID=A0A9W9LM02_9EURO|nr:hypothetical protein N7492_007348 [Penicillium capsulatum]KAJ6117188.1 hypothetical protein N7512_006913 [Penicillium capsulatum]
MAGGTNIWISSEVKTDPKAIFNLRPLYLLVHPFCVAEGVGLIPWSPLARGLLARPWQDEKTKRWFAGDKNEVIVKRVEEVAEKKQCEMGAVAMAWLLQKGACPIVGLNSIERIEATLETLDVELSGDEMNYLERAYHPLASQAI